MGAQASMNEFGGSLRPGYPPPPRLLAAVRAISLSQWVQQGPASFPCTAWAAEPHAWFSKAPPSFLRTTWATEPRAQRSKAPPLFSHSRGCWASHPVQQGPTPFPLPRAGH